MMKVNHFIELSNVHIFHLRGRKNTKNGSVNKECNVTSCFYFISRNYTRLIQWNAGAIRSFPRYVTFGGLSLSIINNLHNYLTPVSVEHLLEHFNVRLSDNFDVRLSSQLLHE